MYYGNNAIDYTKLNLPNNEVKKKPVKKLKVNKKKVFFTCLIIFVCLFSIVFSSVRVSVLSKGLTALQKEKTTLETNNQVARLELDKNLDLGEVERIAMNKLGMVRPEKYQIIYISPEGGDYTEKVYKKNEKGGILASIFGGER